MQLIADRFVRLPDRRVIDLSSGGEVVLIMSSAGGVAEQTRWTVRCDTLSRLRHFAMARLIDYGRIGETHRFEAWAAPRSGAAVLQPARARMVVDSFLRANGLTTIADRDPEILKSASRVVLMPGPSAGYLDSACSREEMAAGIDCYGMALIDRRQLSAVAELFADSNHATPRAVGVWGPIGSGVETAVCELARAARLTGLVPVDVRVAAAYGELLGGRTLCLIDRSGIAGSAAAAGWCHLLQGVLRCAKPHLLLLAARNEVSRAAGVGLAQIGGDSLIDSLRPRDCPESIRRLVHCAARQSQGLPGRFSRFLWGAVDDRPGHRIVTARRVAERAAPYEVSPSTEDVAQRDGPQQPPATAEVAGLRERLDTAVAMLRSGSHAAGIRLVRQMAGALSRRHDWAGAGRATLMLAAALLKRGKPRDAQAALAACEKQARSARDEGLLLEIAILSGCAWTDLTKLDEAENTLRAALAMADVGVAETSRGRAALALARCLFWRGRYDEAASLIDRPGSTADARSDPALAAVGAWVAVGRRDVAGAVSRSRSALQAAEQGSDPAATALAAYAATVAHLAVGDAECVERHAHTCIKAARAARDPLRAIKARLLGAESARRTGSHAAAARMLARVQRLSAPDLPPIVRARCALIGDLITSPVNEVVERHVAASGLPALALFAPRSEARSVSDVAADDLIEVLRCCQIADEDAALGRAVATLRPRVGAAGLGVFVREGSSVVPIAGDGGRIDPDIAARVMDMGQTLPPHNGGERPAGGAAIRYGGRTLGALVARWTLGTSLDRARVSGILTVCATAVAPAVAAAIARRANPADVRDGLARELLGASRAMDMVRSAVERAAAAPFAVLIEGESGSGKELVARGIHRRSPRRDRPFCTLNCAALPDDLVESELFGHARGAFTGAVAERPGVFEEAHTGTLFLDEIGELSLRAQAKVLRTIQEGELRRVGENVSRRVDVRIVAATNRTLADEVAAGRFRLDLLYRLDVIRIQVPPLRERPEDIAILVEHIWHDAVRRVGSHAVLSTATVAALARYKWPGNVRELQNVLAALAVRSPRRGVVPPAALPPVFGASIARNAERLDEARRTFEERFVRAALVRTGGHRGRAAEELGVSRQGLTKLMARLGIDD